MRTLFYTYVTVAHYIDAIHNYLEIFQTLHSAPSVYMATLKVHLQTSDFHIFQAYVFHCFVISYLL